MIRALSAFVFILSIVLASPARAETLTGYTLDGASWSWPSSLTAPMTLVIVQFDAVDEAAAAPLRATATKAGLAHITLVVLGDRERLGRVAGAGRIRAAVGPDAPHNAIVPIFATPASVRSLLQIDGAGAMHTMMVDRDGRISAAAENAATEGTVATTNTADPRFGDRVAAAALEPPAALDVAAITKPAPARAFEAPLVSPPVNRAVARDISGVTISGLERTTADVAVLALAASIDDLDALTLRLSALRAEGKCDGGCLGLVAMGRSPRPTRAIAAGRVRGAVADASLHDLIMPAYLGGDELFQRFDAPQTEQVAVFSAQKDTPTARR
jgi:hypothetical protein